MSKIENLLIFTALLMLIVACSTDRQNNVVNGKMEAAGFEAARIENNSIVIDSQGSDILLTEELLKEGLKEHLLLAGLTVDFTDLRVVSEVNGSGEIHVLRAKDYMNGVDTTVPLQKRADGKFLLGINAGTCSCKSKSCSSGWGCNASGEGSTCSCSPCSGNDCEKTSTSVFGGFMVEYIASLD